jgi:4-amino-4-deoxy-L-arabinose transferase-like glycosyltransferase
MTNATLAGAAGSTGARVPVWLIALLCLMAFAFQGTRGIWEPDEGRYTAAGINMHESGDWLVPTVDGEHPHLTKPPITYWALAASFALLGHNEWGARLPGALAFIGTGLLLFGLGRRLCPSRPWLPPVIWSLSLGPVVAANVVSTDPLLTFFETLAMFAFVEAWSRDGAQTRRWYLLMWLGWGLAFMTKGPPGLLPLLASVTFLAMHDRGRLRSLFMPTGLLLFVVVAFSWFAILVAQEPARLGYFLGYEVYDRIFTSTHDRNAQWYGGLEVYLPVLLAGTLPWSVLSLVAAGGPRSTWRQWRQRLRQRQPDWLLLSYWLLVPLLVFFLARSRLHLYVLPLFVPLALMMARPLARWQGLDDRRFAWIAAITAVCLLALKSVAAHWPSDRDSRALARELSRILQLVAVEEIVFVGMHPFYGLSVYMDHHVEGIEIGENRFQYSKYVGHEDLCAEIDERESTVFGVKQSHTGMFLAAAGRCGVDVRLLGSAYIDGADVNFYSLQTPVASAPLASQGWQQAPGADSR